jgi:hypothetical protein
LPRKKSASCHCGSTDDQTASGRGLLMNQIEVADFYWPSLIVVDREADLRRAARELAELAA